MTTTAVTLAEAEYTALSAIAQQTGKTEAEVLQEAVQHYPAALGHARGVGWIGYEQTPNILKGA